MRFTLLSLAVFVALLLGPRVEMADPGGAGLVTAADIVDVVALKAVPAAEGLPAALSERVGVQALSHLLPPRRDTMPVLPDLPPRAQMQRADLVPRLDAAPPMLVPRDAGAGPQAEVSNALADVVNVERVVTVEDVAPPRSAGKFLTPPKRNARVLGNRLALRSGPAKAYPSVAALARGTDLRITGARKGNYVPVQIVSTGAAGWVFHSYVERLDQNP